MQNIQYKSGTPGLASQCETVLRSIPEWFGVEEALQAYLDDIQHMSTFSAWSEDAVIGFITVNYHFPESAELHVLGIHKHFHGLGVGSTLYTLVETELKKQKIKYIQVKTLSPRAKNPGYMKTLKFYTKHGFVPLEDSTAFWGKATPCLQMIKSI
ncbi:GNAT family N-acetyltransferase [Desulfoluna spongiiphila]|uniref:GNAT family N-acetyltransferase n=1 Tax=Desulfoluna spongiiphila TaxID=419481 RepID=UPI00125F9A5B|nr:GNAT family N-acetyltransferase [Desulfoluna spongiiphila]